MLLFYSALDEFVTNRLEDGYRGKPLRSIFGQEQQLSLLAPGWDEDEGYRCGDVCDT